MDKYATSFSCGLQIVLKLVSVGQLERISAVLSFTVLDCCFKHSQASLEGHLIFSQISGSEIFYIKLIYLYMCVYRLYTFIYVSYIDHT